mmetsp:Transcript_11219/g.28305  ORF Transcript_11219/g.28305 Transcript_11219/m.28305 type:complete len:219 (+) Transcript_11219:118-774(+)
MLCCRTATIIRRRRPALEWRGAGRLGSAAPRAAAGSSHTLRGGGPAPTGEPVPGKVRPAEASASGAPRRGASHHRLSRQELAGGQGALLLGASCQCAASRLLGTGRQLLTCIRSHFSTQSSERTARRRRTRRTRRRERLRAQVDPRRKQCGQLQVLCCLIRVASYFANRPANHPYDVASTTRSAHQQSPMVGFAPSCTRRRLDERIAHAYLGAVRRSR